MNKHIFWMIIGCGLPLLLIFFAPALDISRNISLFIFIVAIFGCHLLMPMIGYVAITKAVIVGILPANHFLTVLGVDKQTRCFLDGGKEYT